MSRSKAGLVVDGITSTTTDRFRRVVVVARSRKCAMRERIGAMIVSKLGMDISRERVWHHDRVLARKMTSLADKDLERFAKRPAPFVLESA